MWRSSAAIVAAVVLGGGMAWGQKPASAPTTVPVAVSQWWQQAQGQFDKARSLEQRLNGQDAAHEAFLAYLAIPGAEQAAVRIARAQAAVFLPVTEKLAGEAAYRSWRPRILLVRGDLQLAQGDRSGALQSYREVAASIASDDHGWEQGHIPRMYYPVDLSPRRDDSYMPEPSGILRPFVYAGGSHRDNWLIRRFIALEAWDDASSEFARIWTIHQQAAKEKQFSGLGLQFALDYAYFLKRQKRQDEAIAVLGAVMNKIDFDAAPVLGGPEAQSPMFYFFATGSPGVSRADFIRLAFGEIRAAGQEPAIENALLKQVGAGHNAARKVLSQIRQQQGRVDDALALELEYIEAARLDPLSAAYRRGLIYEQFQKTAEAAGEYEKALSLPFVPITLPAPDEEALQRRMMAQQFQPGQRNDELTLHTELGERLCRLYAALGRTDKQLDLTLSLLAGDNRMLASLPTLEQTLRSFSAAGEKLRLHDWATAKLQTLDDPLLRANLRWAIADKDGAMADLATAIAAKPAMDRQVVREWRERLRGDKPHLREMLAAMVKADPKDARSRLELLDLENDLSRPKMMEALELLLDQDAQWAFVRGKGDYVRTQFTGYSDLAYRLGRLYAQGGDWHKLQTLAQRMAKRQKPFANSAPRYEMHGDVNDEEEYADALLALAVAHADTPEDQQAMAEALKGSPWDAARHQLERRLAGGFGQASDRAFAWANEPAGVKLIASNEAVLSLATDREHIYAGHPWGVAIYDLAGRPLKRVALGEPVRHLASVADAAWAGTAEGVYRIDAKTLALSHLACDQDCSPRERAEESTHRGNSGVTALGVDGDLLWIATWHRVMCLNTASGTLRIFTPEEGSPRDVGNFIFTDAYVWADSRDGSARYDRKTGSWQPLGDGVDTARNGREALRILGVVDGVLWGNVYVNDELRSRPCIIDPQRLTVAPISIADPYRTAARCINGPFVILGKYQGKVAFAADGRFYYDPAMQKLRPFPDSASASEIDVDVPYALHGGLRHGQAKGDILCADGNSHAHIRLERERVPEMRQLARLPDGTRIMSGPAVYDELPCASASSENLDGCGGLYLLNANGELRHISAAGNNSILGGIVRFALHDEATRTTWLGTNFGLSALDQQWRVVHDFTRLEGLCANHVSSGVAAGGKLYFATEWGDSAGGLAVLDARTSIFTALFAVDGLASNKLKTLNWSDGSLDIEYDWEYRRYSSGGYQRFPTTTYNPATDTFSPRPMPEYGKEPQSLGGKQRGNAMPYLGGDILGQESIGGRTIIRGTHGLAVLDAGAVLTPGAVMPMPVKLVLDPSVAQLAEAQRTSIPDGIELEQLKSLVGSDNPYLVANALAAALGKMADHPECTPIVAGCIGHPNLRVRSTAMILLMKASNDAATNALRAMAGDTNRMIRESVAVELARRGALKDLSLCREILRRGDRTFNGNTPFGANSSWGVLASAHQAHEALATHATPEVLELFMEYPPQLDAYDNKTLVYPQLGAALARHPEAAEALLKVRDDTDSEACRYVENVFRFAGKDMLPVLHQALGSNDRVMVSNAARACGAIGERSSIAPLLKALQIESALARASIVAALGQLKAEEAVDALIRLYAQTSSVTGSSAGAFRAMQMAGSIQVEYARIADLGAIRADYDELQRQGKLTADLQSRERLLSRGDILQAVAQIGGDAASKFYRGLAADPDRSVRESAARSLADGSDAQRAENRKVLQSLLADAEADVRMEAAVSLIICGDDAGRQPILSWLGSKDIQDKERIIYRLSRVADRSKLSFASAQLQAIADDAAMSDELRKQASQLIR